MRLLFYHLIIWRFIGLKKNKLRIHYGYVEGNVAVLLGNYDHDDDFVAINDNLKIHAVIISGKIY